MAMTKRSFKLSDYTRISDPNNKMIAELTRKAMGRRTLADFACVCGVSTATMFRVVNEKIRSPLSDALIVAIAQNADPQSGVSKEMMIAAHGLAKNENNSNTDYSVSNDDSRNSTHKYIEELYISVIRDFFLDNDYSIYKFKREETVFYYDFSVETNVLSEFGIDTWHFETFYTNGWVMPLTIKNKMARIIEYCYFSTPRQHKEKISLIVDSKDVLERIKKDYSQYTFRDVVSIILVDTVNKKIVEEYQFPLAENDFSKTIFNP